MAFDLPLNRPARRRLEKVTLELEAPRRGASPPVEPPPQRPWSELLGFGGVPYSAVFDYPSVKDPVPPTIPTAVPQRVWPKGLRGGDPVILDPASREIGYGVIDTPYGEVITGAGDITYEEPTSPEWKQAVGWMDDAIREQPDDTFFPKNLTPPEQLVALAPGTPQNSSLWVVGEMLKEEFLAKPIEEQQQITRDMQAWRELPNDFDRERTNGEIYTEQRLAKAKAWRMEEQYGYEPAWARYGTLDMMRDYSEYFTKTLAYEVYHRAIDPMLANKVGKGHLVAGAALGGFAGLAGSIAAFHGLRALGMPGYQELGPTGQRAKELLGGATDPQVNDETGILEHLPVTRLGGTFPGYSFYGSPRYQYNRAKTAIEIILSLIHISEPTRPY